MRLISVVKAKIHCALVTDADINYQGSIGIDSDLMLRVGLNNGEQVAVWNINTGARFETYAIPLPSMSGSIVVNGAAARHCQAGDKIIIAAFCLTDEPVEPRMIAVDEANRFARNLVPECANAMQSS